MRELPLPDVDEPDHRSPLRYLTWVARRQVRPLTGGMLLGVVWMVSQALMPAVIGQAIDDGVMDKDASALVAWSGVLLLLGIMQAVSGIMRHRFAVFNWLAAAYRTVQVVNRQVTRLGGTLLKRLTTGEVVSVGVADVSHIGGAMDILARGSGAVVSIVVVAVILLATSPPLGLIVVVGVPVILALAAPLLRPFHRRQHRQRELAGELNTRATDIVAGLRVLRGIGGEQVFGTRYREESQRVRGAGVEVARAESMLAGAEVLLPGLLIALVTWIGAGFAVKGTITPGELVAFYGYAVFLIQPMRTIGEAADRITKAHVAAGRVVRILAMRPELANAGTRVPPAGAELIDVESGLVVRPGLFTAVAAADPAEARALADRLGRYAEGPVTYGGIPLAEIADVRRRVLVAVNEDTLFSGPFRDALLSPSSDEADLGPALYAACAEDLVDTVGLDAHVAEAGREFSGGQQQRLRLARALLADPDVLVLVEPTSAVDAHTEARIAERLGKARYGPRTGDAATAGTDRATVVCTSSPLVLDQADHVAYVRGGVVVAEGTHRELLRNRPDYAAAVTRGQDR
ncbi:ABC transporter transmembrane domain-containing protein [Actinomadura sp. HBU206391]|uniref:ABC transporter transmembrane domain-containing protein n=1 Tax=Actinomadura sp. HBU206391 TaxID=2731692 RepID=UPI001650777D|nr:ABC transporter ATP-binding protein [Actinomadura sp. HBU206391]MBC6457780.1 ABC transporter ATP-binding protein [Actinomadura sp. HBU206391]